VETGETSETEFFIVIVLNNLEDKNQIRTGLESEEVSLFATLTWGEPLG
jgi:hypothetical protein